MSAVPSINELDMVVLTQPIPAEGLDAGDIGTVVHAYGDGAAFEIEVIDESGQPRGVVTLPAGHVWSVEGLKDVDLLLLRQYLKVGHSVDQLPYTPEFERIYAALADAGDRRDRASVYKALLSLRKSGRLPLAG
jgi:hypothetical protein